MPYSDDNGHGVFDNEDVVRKFMETHDEGNGWIIKLSFMTNFGGRKFCESRGTQ